MKWNENKTQWACWWPSDGFGPFGSVTPRWSLCPHTPGWYLDILLDGLPPWALVPPAFSLASLQNSRSHCGHILAAPAVDLLFSLGVAFLVSTQEILSGLPQVWFSVVKDAWRPSAVIPIRLAVLVFSWYWNRFCQNWLKWKFIIL